MAFSPKKLGSDYFKKKKPLSIALDAVFVIVLLLLLIPATRKDTVAFFIRWTSLPPSTLDRDEQFFISSETRSWQLYDLDGRAYRFDELNGKPVFLNIWATWCPPCIAELPGIRDLEGEFGEEVNFILMSNEDPETIRKFLEKNGYSELPVYYAFQSPGDFASQSIPATFIIDREGRVVLKKLGAARWNSGKIRNLLVQLNEK
jgi:thiol-disulfide isomerase/thioredoxin